MMLACVGVSLGDGGRAPLETPRVCVILVRSGPFTCNYYPQFVIWQVWDLLNADVMRTCETMFEEEYIYILLNIFVVF